MSSEYCMSLVVAGPSEDHESCTGSCLKGDCRCKVHDKQVHFIHGSLMLLLATKKGRSLFTTVHKDLLEMEQLLRWLLRVY